MTDLLRVRGLTTHFATKGGVVRAVDGVDLTVAAGTVLGLVGESGSGKSVTGLSILRLVDPPGRIVAGSVEFDGTDLATLDDEGMRRLRGDRIAMIFQDPMMTLNPVLSIGTQMRETLTAHPRKPPMTRDAMQARLVDTLARVGIASPTERLAAYPHQLSGGMRQRVAIAIALLNDPALIVCDEPTTALDVTIQAQVLAQMQALIAGTRLALIWITHDLTVVAGLADRVAVMYAGRIVESGTTAEIVEDPRHPYTRGLIDSTPAAAMARDGGGGSAGGDDDGDGHAGPARIRADDCGGRGRDRSREGTDGRSGDDRGDQASGGADEGRYPRRSRRLLQIPGSPPSLAHLPRGCAFRPRCPRAEADCLDEPPETIDDDGRTLRCFHPLSSARGPTPRATPSP